MFVEFDGPGRMDYKQACHTEASEKATKAIDGVGGTNLMSWFVGENTGPWQCCLWLGGTQMMHLQLHSNLQ